MKAFYIAILITASFVLAEDINILNVTGTCSIKRKADLAYVKIGVSTLNSNMDSAMSAAKSVSKKIIQAAKKYSITEKYFETSQFQVNSVYRKVTEQKDSTIFIGYQIENQYKIKVEDLLILNRLLSAIFSIGSNKLEGVDFLLKNEDEVKSECMELAISNGKRDGEKMAKASGVKLIKLSKISHETPSYDQYHTPRVSWGNGYASYGSALSISERATNYSYEMVEVIPAEIEITGKVYLTYEIQ